MLPEGRGKQKEKTEKDPVESGDSGWYMGKLYPHPGKADEKRTRHYSQDGFVVLEDIAHAFSRGKRIGKKSESWVNREGMKVNMPFWERDTLVFVSGKKNILQDAVDLRSTPQDNPILMRQVAQALDCVFVTPLFPAYHMRKP